MRFWNFRILIFSIFRNNYLENTYLTVICCFTGFSLYNINSSTHGTHDARQGRPPHERKSEPCLLSWKFCIFLYGPIANSAMAHDGRSSVRTQLSLAINIVYTAFQGALGFFRSGGEKFYGKMFTYLSTHIHTYIVCIYRKSAKYDWNAVKGKWESKN